MRASPAFVLRSFGELAPEEREALADLASEGDYYGVLLPRDPASGLSAKALDLQAARLLGALSEPLDPSVPPPGPERLIAALVLDGVLEIESPAGFVSGPNAHPLIFGDGAGPKPNGEGGRLTRLSWEGLGYALALPLDDTRALAGRLYAYNTFPDHPRWRARLGLRDAVEAILGIDGGGPLATRLEASYAAQTFGGWFSWMLSEEKPKTLHHKLYVSPHPEATAAVFRIAAETFCDCRVPAFKVGCEIRGLLRPDKIVAHVKDFEGIKRLARELAPRLAGYRAQGVPFTAELAGDGMLSWGVDPEFEAALVKWRGLESWRLRLCNQLAASLLQARRDPTAAVDPRRFAVDRLALDGVDAATWTPVATRDA
jgi:hypothetical protein